MKYSIYSSIVVALFLNQEAQAVNLRTLCPGAGGDITTVLRALAGEAPSGCSGAGCGCASCAKAHKGESSDKIAKKVEKSAAKAAKSAVEKALKR